MRNLKQTITLIAILISCAFAYSQNGLIKMDLIYFKYIENASVTGQASCNEKLVIDTVNKRITLSEPGYPDRFFRILNIGKIGSNSHLQYLTKTTNKNQEEGVIIIEQDTFYKTLKFIAATEFDKPLDNRTFMLYNYK